MRTRVAPTVVRTRYARGCVIGEAFDYVDACDMASDHVFKITLSSGVVVFGAPEPFDVQFVGFLALEGGRFIASSEIAMIEVQRGSDSG